MGDQALPYVVMTAGNGKTPRVRRPLTRDDWTGVALRSLAEGGLSSVAVETLAERLGATKGSAYWHFPNRDALLAATLRRWEKQNIRAVDRLRAIPMDPRARLRMLFSADTGLREGNAIEIALLASRSHPLVADVVSKVTSHRLAYLEWVFGLLGFDPVVAARRAWLAYSCHLGHVQLTHCAADPLPGVEDLSCSELAATQLEEMMRALLADPGSG